MAGAGEALSLSLPFSNVETQHFASLLHATD